MVIRRIGIYWYGMLEVVEDIVVGDLLGYNILESNKKRGFILGQRDILRVLMYQRLIYYVIEYLLGDI